jgi:hypothetical protein
MRVTRAVRVAAPLAILGIVLTSGLAACAPAGETEHDPAKNRDQWAMPLDEFMKTPTELANYAEQLLISKCLAAKGYEWPVPWQDTDFSWGENFNSVGLRLFNTEIAAEYGYHRALPVDDPETDAWAEFGEFVNSYAPDAQFDDTFLACSDEARDDQTVPDADAFNYASDLAVQASTEAAQTEAVVSATSQWRECLSEQVDWAIPKDPNEWPTSEFFARFKITGPDAVPVPSAEEIEIAVTDAECRESSGMSEAQYDAEWDAQLRLVAQNRDTLERNRDAGIEHEKELLIVVAENAPPAP